MISSFGCTAKNICKWSSKQICLSLKFDEVDVCMNDTAKINSDKRKRFLKNSTDTVERRIVA